MNTGPSFTAPDGKDPAAHILRLEEAIVPNALDLINAGHILRSRRRQRTLTGSDTGGEPFTAYSEKYAAWKQKKGGGTTVNLFGVLQSEHMLNAITVRSGSESISGTEEPTGALLSQERPDAIELSIWGDPAVRAKVHNEGGTVGTRWKGLTRHGRASFQMPRRHFFDANAEDIELMAFSVRERALIRASVA